MPNDIITTVVVLVLPLLWTILNILLEYERGSSSSWEGSSRSRAPAWWSSSG